MGSCFPLLSDLLLLDCRYRACAMKWHLDRHQEPDSGPSQNLHRSPHKETLNGHSLVSLSSNRDGSSPISGIAPSTSKTLDRSSSSMEDTETLDDNHDSYQSLVHFGPQPLSIDGSSEAMRPQG
ncbi:hypothetical protein Patl1_32370 [Pistacia atlantica]|uniref:Uncharacterized protein n=1 Tax=Pistacia atlantica TaxID=434234 RepID=A0ACC1ANN8_9ROSI|nr:hypothetical protein Patl1_32370 [Pistacia atlantica]